MTKEAVTIRFETTPYTLEGRTIARLPDEVSKSLSSRGQAAVTGTINGHGVRIVLEPDGNWGHWMYITEDMHAPIGKVAMCELTTTKDWPEPEIPKDIADALKLAPTKVQDKWKDITPMARWEWIRWVNSTGNMDTRQIRIEKTISKLNGKHRRPCCFNLAACTEPKLAKSGRLIGVME